MEGIAPISKGDFVVRLKGPEGFAREGSFHLEDLGGSCKLTLRAGENHYSATSSDFFDALVQLRRRLEKDHIFPICYGASRNVYPTDFSRAVAQGLMAQRWEQGRRAPEGLVFIFHSGADVEPVSVAEQREAHQRWVAEQAVLVPLDDEANVPKLAA